MNYRHIFLKFLRFLPVEKAGAVTSKKASRSSHTDGASEYFWKHNSSYKLYKVFSQLIIVTLQGN